MKKYNDLKEALSSKRKDQMQKIVFDLVVPLLYEDLDAGKRGFEESKKYIINLIANVKFQR